MGRSAGKGRLSLKSSLTKLSYLLNEMPAKTIRIIFLGLILSACYFMLRITLPYLSFHTSTDFLKTKQGIIHLRFWRYAFFAHVMSSVIVLFCGAFQFLPGIMKRWPRWHRGAGTIYVILVLCISGPGAFVMAFYANGGWPARLSFIILSVVWLYTTAMAYRLAIRKKFEEHRAFMIRSYALTFSAITLRSYAFILPSILILKPKPEYILISWLSWVPNLIIAEWCIRNPKKQTGLNSSLPTRASQDPRG